MQLRGGEVRNIGFDLFDIRDIAEQHRGVDPVFVDGVEIREEHVAPEIELVERLGVILRVNFIELCDEPDTVARHEARNLAHQVVDRHPFGLPHGPLGDARQGVDEEQPCTPRRKEQRTVGQPLPVTGIEVLGDFIKKGFHSTRVMSPPMNFEPPRTMGGTPL